VIHARRFKQIAKGGCTAIGGIGEVAVYSVKLALLDF